MKREKNLNNISECGLPDILLSGIFRCPIVAIDVFSIERWNGLKTIATSFTMEVEFKGKKLLRRVQLMHPFGVYPFPQHKIDDLKERELSGWKGFILSVGAKTEEIDLISSNFIEYPVQGTMKLVDYYRLLEECDKEMEEVKSLFQRFVGRKCLIQVVDSGAKDHTGVKRNFALNQFLSERAGEYIYKAYKENLKDDISLSSIGAGVSVMGHWISK